MKKITSILLLIILTEIGFFQYLTAQSTYQTLINQKLEDGTSLGAALLVKAYPDFLEKVEGNYIIWKDGTRMEYDDGRPKPSFKDLFEMPDLEDQMSVLYPKGKELVIPTEEKNNPGRYRYEPLFKKMYGSNEAEARSHLVKIIWLPKHINQSFWITSVNDVHIHLQAISDDLDKLIAERPEYLKYLENIGGTFNWRTIRNTPNRLSPHSFGIGIDINVANSDYWQWGGLGNYRNRIPMEIVEIFENHFFIWGGKWYYYDTMHFEYRPEFFVEIP